MKINFTVIALIFISLLACTKKTNDPTPTPSPAPIGDTVAPILTLGGKAHDTTYLQIAYIDAFATATDNVDGNISSAITVSGTVNNSVTGSYFLYYNVKDAAGNKASTITRTVQVLNSAGFLVGSYNVACSYTAFVAGNTPTITTKNYVATAASSFTTNNNFTINPLSVGPVNVITTHYLSGNSFSTYYNNSAYPLGSSTSTISASKTSFTIETTTYDQNTPSKIHYCKNVFTKQ